MFLNYAPIGTPLFFIYRVFGKRAYLGSTFLMGAGVARAMHLPVEHWKKRHHYGWEEQAKVYLP